MAFARRSSSSVQFWEAVNACGALIHCATEETFLHIKLLGSVSDEDCDTHQTVSTTEADHHPLSTRN